MFALAKSTKSLRGTIRSAQRTARLAQHSFRSIHSDSKQVRVLVTGATGQIGTELVPHLRRLYGAENVIASDIREAPREFAGGPFEILDVMDAARMKTVFEKYGINRVYHLASLLSAVGEKNPHLAMKLNTRGIENILELARQPVNPNFPMRVFAPSTIAVFGPSTPPNNVPDTTIMRPTTIYGVTKVYLELLGEYYHRKFNVDFRSVRFPGIISSVGAPGGGTTDYAVEIYHEAIRSERTPGGTTFNCFLKPDSALPMMYMSDALECSIQLMEADNKVLTQRTYNVQGMSFSPAQVYAAVHKHVPSMKIEYKPDFRQQIADSWPRSLDDSIAKRDWKYSPKFDLEAMTVHMLESLRRTLPHPEAASATAKPALKQAMQ